MAGIYYGLLMHYVSLASKNLKLDYMSHIMRKLLMSFAYNKDTDQPAHLRSLISVFVVNSLDSIICIDVLHKISRL